MPRRTRVSIVVLVAVALVAGGAALSLPWFGAKVVRTRVLPRLEERLGRRVDVGDVHVGWGRVELTDVRVDGAGTPSPVAAPRISARFRVWPLLRGQAQITTVTVEKPRFNVVRGESGEDNVSALLRKLRGKDDATGTAPAGGHHTSGPEEVRVEGGSLTVEDDALGSVEVAAFDASVKKEGEGSLTLVDVEVKLAAGPWAKADKVRVSFDVKGAHLVGLPSVAVEGGEVHIWRGFAVTGIAGGITPDESEAGRANIDLHGGYGGVDKVLWSARGWAVPRSRKGALKLVADRFDLGQVARALADTPILDPAGTLVDARLDLAYAPDDTTPDHLHDALDFDGSVHVAGLSVFHHKLAPVPVRKVSFDASARGRFEPRGHALKVDSATVDTHGVHLALDVDLARLERLKGWGKAPPEERLGHLPLIRGFHVEVPAVSCQTVLEAIPAELVPRLQGFKLQGTFKSEIHAAIDPDDLDEMDLGSAIGIDGCKVTQSPAGMGVERMQGTFQHAVEVEPGSWLAFPVGPENPDWVPYAEISQNLVNSIMTTEDSNFLQHKGFIGREFKSALRTNLEHGEFKLGASSITMQMVKNVLLTREKTLSRKLQEMFLTWYVERHLGKERILEIYFNVIEYGPGIYGIGRASRHYFGKTARELTPREATFFSSILPSPKKRYVHYCKGPELDQKWELYLNRILKRMHERGRLTDEEFDKAMATPLVFDRAEAMPTDKCMEMIRRFSTPQSPAAIAQGGNHIPIPLGNGTAPVRVTPTDPATAEDPETPEDDEAAEP